MSVYDLHKLMVTQLVKALLTFMEEKFHHRVRKSADSYVLSPLNLVYALGPQLSDVNFHSLTSILRSFYCIS